MWSPQELGFPDHFDQFRDAQVEAIEHTLTTEKRFVGIGAPPGVGKSGIAYAVGKLLGGRTIILTSNLGLQDQYAQFPGVRDIRGRSNYSCWEGGTCEDGGRMGCGDKSGCPYLGAFKAQNEADIVVTSYAYWLAVHEKGQGIRAPDTLICDECFPAGTLIDGKPIETLTPGDFVTAFDPASGKFNKRRITQWRAKRPTEIVRLTFKSGRTLAVTSNHPFFTVSGWKPASETLSCYVLCYQHAPKYLQRSSVLVVRKDDSDGQQEVFRLPATGPSGLQSLLRLTTCSQPRNHESRSQEESIGIAQGAAQPDERSSLQREDENQIAFDGLATSSEGRKREWADRFSTSFSGGTRMADGISYFGETAAPRLSNELQAGYSQPGLNGWDRSRWEHAQRTGQESTGQEEGEIPFWDRVDRIEVFKQGSDKEFDELCPDGFVYNLEVETDHTYVANGFVVHNCGQADSWLSRALDFYISEKECREAGVRLGTPQPGEDLDGWVERADRLWSAAKARYATLKATAAPRSGGARDRLARDLRRAESFVDRSERLAKLDANWVCTREDGTDDGRQWKFECIWPGKYREKLFRWVPRVILMSATLRPKTLGLNGIGRGECDFREWGRQFPAVNGPVLYIPTVRVNHRLAGENELRWLKRSDEIVKLYPDRRGLSHTVSYDRAKKHAAFLRECGSKHIVLNGAADLDNQNARQAFEKHINGPVDSHLISPSFGTGWDFKKTAAEYQIIAKIPTKDMRSKVMAARREKDRGYEDYLAAQDLVQECGRINREADDLGTTYITDNSWEWFKNKAADHFPRWFRVRKEETLPPPLPKIK